MILLPSCKLKQSVQLCLSMALAVLMMAATASFTSAAEPPIVDLAFTPDGKQLLGASQKGITVWSWPELKPVKIVSTAFPNVHCLEFAPDGEKLAVGGGAPAEYGEVRLFTWPELRTIASSRIHDDSVSDLCWLDRESLASTGYDRQAFTWTLKPSINGKERELQATALDGHSRAVRSVVYLEQPEVLVTAGNDLSLRVWTKAKADSAFRQSRTLNQHTQPVLDLAVCPSDRGPTLIASSAEDKTVRFWQPRIGRFVRYAKLDSPALRLCWLDAEHLAAACKDGRVRVINSLTVQVSETLPGVSGWAYALAKHPVNNSLVVAGTDGELKKLSIISSP